MSPAGPGGGERTVVAEPAGEWVLVFLGFPLLGTGAGWLVTFGADRISRWPVLPMGAVVRLIRDAPEPGTTVVALLVGALAGFTLAVIGWSERLVVLVSAREVVLRRGGQARAVPATEIAGAFTEGKCLVLLGPDTREVARESSGLPADRLRRTLLALGYRWHPDGDPWAGQFARWVEGLPGLPTGADALLRARQKALESGDTSDAAALREELSRIGVVVHEQGRRQFWRGTTSRG